ncbi:TPA: hypothetical protein ACHSTH_004796 [Pseudomonas aeruginosa]
MSKFKAGDLVLVVAGSVPENIGKAGELAFKVQDGDCYEPVTPCGHLYHRNTSGAPVWIVVGDYFSSQGCSGFCQKNERNIIPLRGDFHPEQQKVKEEIV